MISSCTSWREKNDEGWFYKEGLYNIDQNWINMTNFSVDSNIECYHDMLSNVGDVDGQTDTTFPLFVHM
jgi:hypothetical protein